MYHAPPMNVVQGIAQLRKKNSQPLISSQSGDCSIGLSVKAAERRSVHVLHRVVGPVINRSGIEDPYDVGMFYLRQKPEFTMEPTEFVLGKRGSLE